MCVCGWQVVVLWVEGTVVERGEREGGGESGRRVQRGEGAKVSYLSRAGVLESGSDLTLWTMGERKGG